MPGAGNNARGFGTGIGRGTPVQTGQPAGTEIPGAGSQSADSPTAFSVLTGYGRAPEVFVLGEGRLARPRFQTRLTTSIGFDDNVFQAPTNPRDIPETVIRQQITAGTEEQVVLVPVPTRRRPQQIGFIGQAPQQPQFRRVVIPAQEPEFEEIVIPGVPATRRQASAVSRQTLDFEVQTATRRTVFTFDLNANVDYYWNRTGRAKEEYNGNLAVRFLHRFNPRLQLSTSVDASYLSQPDFSQINTPTTLGNGNYLVLNARADLSYRWSPRFSSVVTLAYNSLSFDEAARQIGDFQTFTLGSEFRYLWSPRMTLVAEARAAHISYPNGGGGLDATSYFALVGADLSLSRRAGATLRFGTSTRILNETGEGSTAPYLEATVSYQLSRASALSWNTRFGFEEPPDPSTTVLSLRSGLNVTHFFTPRLRGSLGLNAYIRTLTNEAANADRTELTFDSNLTMLYTFTRKWSLNLTYSYTSGFFNEEENNFFRNRIFAGLDYSF